MKKISNIRPRLTSIATALLVAGMVQGCSNSDSSPPSNLFTLVTQGGNGGADNGSGGYGGSVDSYKNNVGNIEFSNSSQVDVGFAAKAITSFTADLGSNPLTIDSDTTIALLAPGDPRPTTAGTPYFVGSGLYLSSGTGSVPATGETLDRVTGIEVAEDVTLTLPLITSSEGQLYVNNDCHNLGVITVEDVDASQRGGVRISCSRYIGSGKVTTFGTQDAQSGGSISINGSYSLYNSGDLLAYGADSAAATTDAGYGGYIRLYAWKVLENTGRLASYGGTATDGRGGSGNDVDISAEETGNSGAFDTYGGVGTTGGGSGGDIDLSADFGALKNTGMISAYGGNASAGSAGRGGSVSMDGATGGLKQNSSVMTYGGNSTDDAGGDGGRGGSVYMSARESSIDSDDYRAPGDMMVSGNIDTRGGNALATGTGQGGNAGEVYFDMDVDSKPQTRRMVYLYGYTSINTSGGDGTFAGAAGSVSNTIDESQADTSVRYAGGSVINRVQIIARGGNVIADTTSLTPRAGSGGRFTLETPYQMGFVESESMAAINTAEVNLSAGTGTIDTNSGASGGDITMWGYTSVENSGAITSNGGNDGGTNGGTDGEGGSGGSIEVMTEMGVASNSGALSINGGNGEYRGGNAGSIYMVGYDGASNTADISGNGGDAKPDLADSSGGDGSWIGLFSRSGANATNTGTVTYDGGTGETSGDNGSLATNDTCTGDNCGGGS